MTVSNLFHQGVSESSSETDSFCTSEDDEEFSDDSCEETDDISPLEESALEDSGSDYPPTDEEYDEEKNAVK